MRRSARLMATSLAAMIAGCHSLDRERPDSAASPDSGPLRDAREPPDSSSPDGLSPDMDARAPDAWAPPGTWVDLEAGTFTMGSPTSESCRDADEEPHEVTLARGFAIMATQVTRRIFQQLLGYMPAGISGCGECPVGNVSWHEAARFCNELSTRSGRAVCYDCSGSEAGVTCSYGASYANKTIYRCPGFRLPTEAEWEYAARAGTEAALHNGSNLTASHCEDTAPEVESIAWFTGNSGGIVQPVGGKAPNDWGLYDMAGNAWDWIHDRYAPDYETGPVTDPVNTSGADVCERGGSYGAFARYLRSANRSWNEPVTRSDGRSFRCVRTLTP